MQEYEVEQAVPAKKQEQQKKDGWAPLAAAAIGHAIWGLSYLFSRVALQIAEPEVVLSLRFWIAIILMSVLILMKKASVSFRGKKWKPLALLAVTELACFYFESYGILYTNATFAGVVSAVSPVVAILMAVVFLREFPTRRQSLFCILPVAGLIIMTISGSSIGVVQPLGVICLICSCISSAAYKTANRKSAEEFTAFERTYIVLLTCAVVFTLSALRTVGGDLNLYFAPLSNPTFLGSVMVLGVFSSVGANMLINYGAARLPVVKLSSFGSLTTLCSMFAGIVFLREPLAGGIFLGAALILIGIRQVTKQ